MCVYPSGPLAHATQAARAGRGPGDRMGPIHVGDDGATEDGRARPRTAVRSPHHDARGQTADMGHVLRHPSLWRIAGAAEGADRRRLTRAVQPVGTGRRVPGPRRPAWGDAHPWHTDPLAPCPDDGKSRTDFARIRPVVRRDCRSNDPRQAARRLSACIGGARLRFHGSRRGIRGPGRTGWLPCRLAR